MSTKWGHYPDFYDGQLNLFDDEEMYRINAFDWEDEFPDIMKNGGFDAVIGNPPYIRIQAMKEWAPVEVEFYKIRYDSASKGNYDIYVVFVEKGLSLLNEKGRLGFILPHKFFEAQYGAALRMKVTSGNHLSKIIHFGDQQVFSGATTYTCLLFLDKSGKRQFNFVKAHNLTDWISGEVIEQGRIDCDKANNETWNFIVGHGSDLFEKLNRIPDRLGDIAHLFVGLQTDADDVYILEQMERKGKEVICKSKATGKMHRFEDVHLKRFVKGSVNIRRYHLSDLTKRLIFPYETVNGKSILISPSDYARDFPLTWAYIEENRSRLSKRNKGRMPVSGWHGYVYRKNHTRLDSSKILVPSLATGATFSPDFNGEFFFVGSGGGGGGGYGISIKPDDGISYLFLLGILNSKLSSFFLRLISTPFRGGYIALNKQFIEKIPIPIQNFKRISQKGLNDQIVNLVEHMLSLHQKMPETKLPQTKTVLQRQIEANDRQIDKLVYKLYDLTDEEIEIVEAASG